MTSNTITFAKLNTGDWGLRGPASQLISGATVTVAKKSGETKQLVVGQILYSRDGQAMATIGSSSSHAYGYDHGHSHVRHSRNGCSCTCENCNGRCQCDSTCNCRGGNIFDC